MALSGNFYGTTSNNRIKPKIEWSAVQNVLENYSDITATLSYSRTNKGYTTEGTWSGSITIDGQEKTDKKRIEIEYNSNTVAITAQVRVYHDNYGAKVLTISAAGSISGTTLTSTNIAAEITLDTIPRASTISAADASIESRSTVVVNRKNAAFTHSIAYSFGELSGYIDADGNTTDQLTKLSVTTINMLLPDSFYSQIPNDPTGVCTLTCTTWADDVQIGEDQLTQFTAVAAEDLCGPIVVGSVTDANDLTAVLTGDANTLVRFCSTARCAISAEARNAATIVEMRIGGNEVSEPVLDIPDVDVGTVEFQATDSRGYTTKVEFDLPLIPYVQLTNNATAQRTDPTSGNAVLVLAGNCWKGNFGATENALEVECKVDDEEPITLTPDILDDNTYSMSVDLSGLDYQKSHTILVTAKDRLEGRPKTLPINKGIPVFCWGENAFQFKVPVDLPELTINGQPIAEFIRSIVEGGTDQ